MPHGAGEEREGGERYSDPHDDRIEAHCIHLLEMDVL